MQQRFGVALEWFEVLSVAVFTAEYVGRLWACITIDAYRRPVIGRIRFALSAMSIIDLLAILPFYLPFVGVDLRFVRVLRLLRIARIAKLGRYCSAMRIMANVARAKKEELVLTMVLMGMVLILSASAMYYCENAAQPDRFPGIPATLWWSVVTLTTVGYGDVFPVTMAGKSVAALIAIVGIGMFALPTGILGAAFVEELDKQKTGPKRCPHCGKDVE